MTKFALARLLLRACRQRALEFYPRAPPCQSYARRLGFVRRTRRSVRTPSALLSGVV